MIKEITVTHKALLSMLGNTLFDACLDVPQADPALVWAEAQMQGVFLLAFHNVDTSGFPEQLVWEMHKKVRGFLMRNVRLSLAHAALSDLLRENGIPHVLIKGHACSVWYPAPELRQLGDVDFIVRRTDVERAGAVLERAGFIPETKSHRLHEIYMKDGVRYEMHFDLPGIPEGRCEDACRRAVSGLIENASVRHTPFGDMTLPSMYEHGLVILLHNAHHLTNSGIGLRQLCDWLVFADAIPDAEFQDLFRVPLKEMGLWQFACCLTDIGARYFGAAEKNWAKEADSETGDSLLADILSGGNLGQKNAQRAHEAYVITSGHESRSKALRMTHLLLDMIYQKWPLSKHHKILVPFGWAFYGGRYFYRAVRGKRPKLRIRAVLREADARIDIYDRLALFEPQEENR